MSATLPRQKNEHTNKATNNGSVTAPVLANHQTDDRRADEPENRERLATEAVRQSRPTELAEKAAEAERGGHDADSVGANCNAFVR